MCETENHGICLHRKRMPVPGEVWCDRTGEGVYLIVHGKRGAYAVHLTGDYAGRPVPAGYVDDCAFEGHWVYSGEAAELLAELAAHRAAIIERVLEQR